MPDINLNNFLLAFSLTLFASLSTGIGSALGFFAKTTNTKFLSIALGFSAGVMIYVSLIEIFPEAHESFTHYFKDEKLADWVTLASFFAGMLLIGIIDKLIPKEKNPHEPQMIESMGSPHEPTLKHKGLLRVGLFTALVIGIHNFPEGLATFTATLENPTLGISIAIAIAIHNIPEGIAVSVPIYYATNNRKKAFIYSFLSGLAEPVGALVGFAILFPFMNEFIFGILFASIAGIMVFISLDELLPAARQYGEHHLSIYGLVLGMLVMGISLALL